MKKSLGPKTLVYPTPVFVIGTYDKNDKPNVMTASWAGISCSQPPCVSVSLRKATYTYENLMERKAFTISIPSEDHLKQTDYIGLVSGRAVDKFAETGLTPIHGEKVEAPYVGEFPMVLECRLVHMVELGLHVQFAGEILDVKVEETMLGAGGLADIKKVRPMVFAPDTQAYYALGNHLGQAFSVGKKEA